MTAVDIGKIASRSFTNCHCKGVHSLLIRDGLRLFYADETHELWRNRPGYSPMSVGFHGHHCDVTLMAIEGSGLSNVVLAPPSGCVNTVCEFAYRSPITSNMPGRFMATGIKRTVSRRHYAFDSFPVQSLSAKTLHTISLPREMSASWLVIEGAEDPSYQPLTYSDAYLETLDWSELYQPMSEETARDILENHIGWKILEASLQL